MPLIAFLVASVYYPGIFGPAYMPKWWAMALGLPLVPNISVTNMRPAVATAWIAGLAWAFALLFISHHPVNGALPFAFMLLLFAVAVAASGLDDIKPTMLALILGLLPSSLLVIPQTLDWWSPVPQSVAPAGLFINREILAEFAAPLLVWALISRRWWWAVIPALPVALCYSRVAVFVVACSLLYAWAARWYWKALCIAAVAVLCVAAFFFLGIGKEWSAGLRMVLWGAAVMSITPLGHGLGWWAAAHPFPSEEFVHSDALQVLVELGLPGALLLAVPVLCWRRRAHVSIRAAFVAVCIEAAVSFPLHAPAQGFLWALLAGFLGSRVAVRGSAGYSRRAGDGDHFLWPAAVRGGVLDRSQSRRRAIPF